MIQRLVIWFFAFFLTSRFFSEVLTILPKWVDVLNYPFIVILGLVGLFYPVHKDLDIDEHKLVFRCVLGFFTLTVLSAFVNINNLLLPAGVLFLVGFMEGPVLFLALDKIVSDIDVLAGNIRKLFMLLLVVNIIIVIFHNIPTFIITGNPDVVSGSYGLNAYQFTMLLVICGGLLMGDATIRKRSKVAFILGQGFIFMTFVIAQFRSGLPFFLLAYAFMILSLYGRKIARTFVLAGLLLGVAAMGISYVFTQAGTRGALGFEAWIDILADPLQFLGYGKFTAYPQTAKMMINDPAAILVGIGPGNYMSRASYTFSYELLRSDKGVALLVGEFFGIHGARFTPEMDKYLPGGGMESVFGSRQLSSPFSSYLAPIGEIGLIGGAIIIGMYLYLIKKSLKLMRVAKESAPEYVPFAVALVGGTVYLFGLAFLDNYWEISRVTLPVWLLFWGTNAGLRTKLKNVPATAT